MNFDLTDREQEIYKLLATTDMTLKEIGSVFVLSTTTIETHRNNIYQKLNISKRSALVRHYYENLLKEKDELIKELSSDDNKF